MSEFFGLALKPFKGFLQTIFLFVYRNRIERANGVSVQDWSTLLVQMWTLLFGKDTYQIDNTVQYFLHYVISNFIRGEFKSPSKDVCVESF